MLKFSEMLIAIETLLFRNKANIILHILLF